jgi:hypothetical protein
VRRVTRALLVEMFDRMVVAKDKSAIPRYYDPDFVMVSNGITQKYEGFRTGHETVYDTPISYAVEYDDESWVEGDDRVAVRLWITTSRPGEDPTRLELVLIATYRDGRILRVWELTWPNWADLPAFEQYET